MKKSVVILGLLSNLLTAFAKPPVTEKVISIFKASFPQAKNVVWTEFEDFYQVYFIKDEVSCRVYYNYNGDVIKSRCDYSGDRLCPFLTAKLSKRFAGKSIYLVTEIASEAENFWIVTLQDQKQFIQARCEPSGEITVLKQLRKN